jgi:3'(2'), 5'-bisphosphate nucleotidase
MATADDLAADGRLAAQIATDAGRLLMKLRAESGLDGKALGAIGDEQANDLIIAALRAARPNDPILSEESKDDVSRTAHRRVWIVDPLDGTREYGEGRADWAVHVGLAVDGAPLVGAVALPGLGETWSTLKDKAAPPRSDRAPIMVVSRTRPAADAQAIAERLKADLLPMGSAGAKALSIVRGEADIYFHTGGMYEWDSCAPAAVAAAYGLTVCRADGSPLVYNRADPYLPDLLICPHALRSAVLG